MKKTLFIIAAVIFTFVACAQDKTYIVGDFHEELGGYIVYVDETRQHGLVCPFFDQGQYIWGCIDKKIKGADGNELYSGKQNTSDIIKRCTDPKIAAKICNDFILLGFDDWYLPSKYELKLMCDNLHQKGIGNFAVDDYWSSNGDGDQNAWFYSFSYDTSGAGSGGKSFAFRVRAVRAF